MMSPMKCRLYMRAGSTLRSTKLPLFFDPRFNARRQADTSTNGLEGWTEAPCGPNGLLAVVAGSMPGWRAGGGRQAGYYTGASRVSNQASAHVGDEAGKPQPVVAGARPIERMARPSRHF